MLLFNPSTGQIVDRLSILLLKLDAATNRGSDTYNLEGEIRECRAILLTRTFLLNMEESREYYSLCDKLTVQNKRQWDYEDAIRRAINHLSNPPTYDELMSLGVLAKGTHLGNEERSKLVAAIDVLLKEAPEQKIYQ